MKSIFSSPKKGEIGLFFERMRANPLRIGAPFPSSLALARSMAKSALNELKPGDYILEIGAGTGRVTKTLLAEGLEANRLISVELDAPLYNYLKEQNPSIRSFHGDARDIQKFLPEDAKGRVGVIISGIPMMNLSQKIQQEIVDSCLAVAKPETPILQFTYCFIPSIRCPGLKARRVATILLNLPPATIWSYSRPLS